jgi:hypothetical protein
VEEHVKDNGSSQSSQNAQVALPGCYLIRFQPETSDPDVLFFEGTLRVIRTQGNELQAGGDLYCRLRSTEYPPGYPWAAQTKDEKPKPPVSDIDKLPKPIGQIPVFNRADYRAYLQIRSIQENVPAQGQVTVFFDAHYFEADARRWPQPGSRMLILSKTDQPDKYKGNVIDQDTGRKIGRAVLHYLSPNLRRARVVLCTTIEPEVNAPDQATFEKAFRNIQWELTTEPKTTLRPQSESQPDSSPGNRPWTIAELHETLQKLRTEDAASGKPDAVLDREWRYYLLCVPDIEGYARGVMFDTYGGDSENVPREAAAIGGHWKFENKDPWGKAKMKWLQKLPEVYARVALHEIGHAMGLDHNHDDDGLMNTTDAIAENAWNHGQQTVKEAREKALDDILNVLGKGKQIQDAAKSAQELETARSTAEDAQFPSNVGLDFHPDDRRRLQLGPDIAVRPGTTYESGGPLFADAAAYRAEDLDLEVMPLLDTVPLGAPVRIGLRLHNATSTRQLVPKYLNLGSGVVSGTVTALATGETRTFWPLKRPLDADPEQTLDPGQFSPADSLTLLRGAQGALFPMAGDYRVQVTVAWERGGTRVFSDGDTTIRVSSAVDDAHRAVAIQLINTPDTLLNLALGGHLKGPGADAITAACSNPILGPHYAVIPARKAVTQHFNTPPNLQEMSWWIKTDTVLSIAEIRSLATLMAETLKDPKSQLDASVSATAQQVATLLSSRLSHLVNCGRVSPADGTELKADIEKLVPNQSKTAHSSLTSA